MTYSIEVSELAYFELEDAYQYYEFKVKGLGKRMYVDFVELVKVIQKAPLVYPKKYKQFRQAKLKKFPYLIVYEVLKNKIVVYRFFHSKRNPNKKYKI